MEAPIVFRRTVIIGLLVAALFVLPSVSAQTQSYGSTSGDERVLADGQKCFDAVAGTDSTCVVLYGHVFDLLNAVPINVQRPPDNARDLSAGFTGTPGYEAFWDFNQLTLFSSPGFVEYPKNSNDPPRLHPERGLSYDVALSPDTDILGYWYLSADFDEFSPFNVDHVPPESGSDPSIGAMPCLEVQMTLQTGRFFGDGDVIAAGSLTKTIVTAAQLAGGAVDTSPVPPHPCPNTDNTPAVVENGDVIEFEVNMGKAQMDIPKLKGFLIHVEWFQFAPNDPGDRDKVYQHTWNLHTGDDYIPRVLIPLENPVMVEKVRPQFFDGKLYVHTVLNSPWGSYDVDHGQLSIEVFDGSGKKVDAQNMDKPILRYSVDHDGHFKAVNATFPWDFKKDGLAPGTYTVKVTAQNWQHTGSHFLEAKVTIASDITKSAATDSEGKTTIGDPEANVDSAESPLGVLPATLIVLALLVAFATRRRL